MEEYFRGMNWLNENKPFFYSTASIAGRPVENLNIDTAQVSFKNGEILFETNPEFFATLSDAEVGAVIAHEAYHIILEHLLDLKKDEYKDQNALLIAHEIIINDSLTNAMFELPDFVMFGKDHINDDASTYSTEEAYKVLEDKSQDSKDSDTGNSDKDHDSASNESSTSSSPGIHEMNQFENISADDIGSFEKAVEDIFNSIQNVKIGDDEAEALPNEVLEKFGVDQDDQELSSKADVNAGNESGAEEMITSNASLTTDWIEVLKIINPDFGKKKGANNKKTTRDWFKQDRRAMHMYPKMLAPTRKITNLDGGDAGTKPITLLALDFSGSIPKHMAKVLAELGQSIPQDMFEVFAITFSTQSVDFDIDKTNNKVASGGTDFSTIERKAKEIERQTGEYPYVLVMTDGEATFNSNIPTDSQLLENWFWFGIDNRTFNYMRNNRRGASYGWGSQNKNKEIFKNIFNIPHKESRMR